jgi:hypothetical protein
LENPSPAKSESRLAIVSKDPGPGPGPHGALRIADDEVFQLKDFSAFCVPRTHSLWRQRPRLEARSNDRREVMRTKFTSSTLLAAVATIGLGIAPALAAGPSNSTGNGYEFPNFWGDAPAQQTTAANVPNQAGVSIGTYVTQTSHGTWLFPPNPNSGGNG